MEHGFQTDVQFVDVELPYRACSQPVRDPNRYEYIEEIQS